MRKKYGRHRSDTAQAEIVDGLRKIGASVLVLDSAIDLAVGFRNKNFLFEVKTKKWSPMTPSQLELFQSWKGQLTRIQCLFDALAVMRKEAGAITLFDDESP